MSNAVEEFAGNYIHLHRHQSLARDHHQDQGGQSLVKSTSCPRRRTDEAPRYSSAKTWFRSFCDKFLAMLEHMPESGWPERDNGKVCVCGFANPIRIEYRCTRCHIHARLSPQPRLRRDQCRASPRHTVGPPLDDTPHNGPRMACSACARRCRVVDRGATSARPSRRISSFSGATTLLWLSCLGCCCAGAWAGGGVGDVLQVHVTSLTPLWRALLAQSWCCLPVQEARVAPRGFWPRAEGARPPAGRAGGCSMPAGGPAAGRPAAAATIAPWGFL